MYPPVYELAASSEEVKRVFDSPPRVYPFGQVPQGCQPPYAAFQTVGGVPGNFINQRPDSDDWSVQVDVYDVDAPKARKATAVLRDALEMDGHIVAWNGEGTDVATGLYAIGFTYDHVTPRG